MNTDKLARLASLGGATDGTFYGIEVTTKTGQRVDVALDQGELEKAVALFVGLANDAARAAPEGVKLTSAAGPFPVTNLTLARGRNADEVVLGIQSGKLAMSFALHPTTLMKLCAAIQGPRT